MNFDLPMPGRHNVYNAVAAIGAALSAGVSLETVESHLKTFSGAPGRLERVFSQSPKSSPIVYVDYAHTPDALEQVLRTLRAGLENSKSSGKIFCVFGCGGDRDPGKRPLMGQVADKFADVLIVTSDNPRSEPPSEIIEQILTGVREVKSGERIAQEPDRRKAIALALQKVGDDDVILIAGKGHEDYQIIGDRVDPFSDVAVTKELLNKAAKVSN